MTAYEPISFYSTLQQETAAERQALLALPIIQETLAGKINGSRYLVFLQQAYHHVKHTVPLLMACGYRLGPEQQWLQQAVAEYIEEEIGHDEWILNDINAAGGDAEQTRNSDPHIATEMMVAYAYDRINRHNPMSFFGMVHVLEGTSITLATQVAHLVQNELSLPTNAFSYLLSHGDLDIEHVKFFEGLMNKVTDPRDQQEIIYSAQRFYQLYGAVLSSACVNQDLGKE